MTRVIRVSQLLGFALPALTAGALAQEAAPGVVILTPGSPRTPTRIRAK